MAAASGVCKMIWDIQSWHCLLISELKNSYLLQQVVLLKHVYSASVNQANSKNDVDRLKCVATKMCCYEKVQILWWGQSKVEISERVTKCPAKIIWWPQISSPWYSWLTPLGHWSISLSRESVKNLFEFFRGYRTETLG